VLVLHLAEARPKGRATEVSLFFSHTEKMSVQSVLYQVFMRKAVNFLSPNRC
jgi:hypothetical protein